METENSELKRENHSLKKKIYELEILNKELRKNQVNRNSASTMDLDSSNKESFQEEDILSRKETSLNLGNIFTKPFIFLVAILFVICMFNVESGNGEVKMSGFGLLSGRGGSLD
jgi:hypothetical protein